MSTGISEPRRRRWLRLRLWLWLSAHYNLSFPSRLDATVESSRVVGRVYRYHSDSKFRRGVVFLNIRLSFPTRLLKYFNSDVVDRHRSFETFRPLGRRVLHRIAFRTFRERVLHLSRHDPFRESSWEGLFRSVAPRTRFVIFCVVTSTNRPYNNTCCVSRREENFLFTAGNSPGTSRTELKCAAS